MERRTSERKPIHLDAQLNWQGKADWPCRIEDFCAEGMFIKFDPQHEDQVRFVYTQQTNNAMTVRFVVRDKSYEALVKPVRMVGNAIGVMFLKSHPDVIAVMLRECSRHVGRAEVVTENTTAAFVVRQFGRALTQHVQPLLEDFFEGIGEKLKVAAEQAPTDRVANGILDSASLVHRSRRIIQANLLDYLASPKKIPTPENPTRDSLSLIDKSEFEEWLSIKVMITKAETQYRGALLQLKMRLDKVGVVNATGYQNPYGPALLCYAFKAASDPLKLFKQAEKVYYKGFETDVLAHLDSLYEELNQILIRQGVLPELDLSKYLAPRQAAGKPAGEAKKTPPPETTLPADKPAAAPTATPSRSESVTEQPISGAKNGDDAFHRAMTPPFSAPDAGRTEASAGQRLSENARARASFDSVQKLFDVLDRTKQGLPADARPDVPEGPSWSPVELQKSLQRLQKLTAQGALSDDVGQTLTDKVHQQLQAEFPDEQRVLPRQEAQTFDVVDQFFSSLMDSEKIGDLAKQQLTKLQIPVVKMLIKDKAVLEKGDSPIRVLLNRIGQLGLKGGRPSPAVQQKIDAVIHRINEEFVDDPKVLEEGIEALDELIERQNQLYRRNVERVMAAAEGAQKIEQAKQRVQEELEIRIAGRKIPRAVVSLINGGWRDLLSLVFIRQGDESEDWRKYLGVLDTLIAYGHDPDTPMDLPEVVKTIQAGLASISSSHMPSGHIRDELKQFIVGARTSAPEMISMPELSSDKVRDLSQSPQAQTKSLKRWVQRAQKLKVGDWIKYLKKDKDTTFMRLVWVGRGYAKYVFVNHQGMKVIELDIIKLAGMMSRGSLVSVPDYEKPIVDESLDNLVKQVYERLSYAAIHDPLTGLVNRSELKRRIERAFSRQGADGQFSLLYLDLRQFRLINDNAGYEAGDRLLKEVAGILKTYAPKSATVARVVGNEFAVLIKSPNIEALAKRYLEVIQAHQFEWKGEHFGVSANIGMVASHAFLTTAEKLLNAAESACREAKASGPNRLHLFQSDSERVSHQDEIVAKIARFEDLSPERVLLRCQKILPLHLDCRLGIHHEILLSVYDDRGHLISAGEFIRMAEFYLRMQTVDRWVVGKMFDWMADNQASLEMLGGVSINLSGHSLNDETLLEFIYDKLSKRNVPMNKICFEITDASSIKAVEDVIDFMQELKETGCTFCLGDFGGGAASHSLLKQLPADLIKIDGSFIQEIIQSQGDQAMVRSMTEMAHMMGKEVIAGMVEDKAALEILTSLGVDYAQGFGIEKPRLVSSVV